MFFCPTMLLGTS